MGNNTARDEVLVVVFDGTAPTVNSPSDINYNESTTGHSITWDPSDLHPHSYAIYLNGTPVRSGLWNSSSEVIVISVDGLLRGTYNYTLVVTDIDNNTAADTVIVTVAPPPTTTVTTTTTTTTTTAPNATTTPPPFSGELILLRRRGSSGDTRRSGVESGPTQGFLKAALALAVLPQPLSPVGCSFRRARGGSPSCP
ncbi:MAG: hypothetical protein HXY34_05790 [Candidatus Thorarchaeota archaeon]|nr:hypothetical protein [Candidatus Thorarchaeota archaeon]